MFVRHLEYFRVRGGNGGFFRRAKKPGPRTGRIATASFGRRISQQKRLLGASRRMPLNFCYNTVMKSLEVLTRNGKATKNIGFLLAGEILKEKKAKHALVISLEGELGSGKTTFTQGFARGLGIKERIQSPTFVILKIYKINKKSNFKNFIHVDAYRLKSKDFKTFGWKSFMKTQNNITLVEWGNKIKNILPKGSLRIIFKHIGHHQRRLIKIFS